MRWSTLSSGRFTYQLRMACQDMMTKYPPSEVDDELDKQAERVNFFDQKEGERFAMHFLKDAWNRNSLIEFIYRDFRFQTSFDLNNPTDEWLAEILGYSMAHDDLRVYRLENQMQVPLITPKKIEIPPPPPVTNPLTWLELKLIWDDTGEPVANLPVVVQGIDGRTNMKRADQQGIVRIDPIEPGACEARCSFSGITVKDCVVFAGNGEKPASSGKSGTSSSASANAQRQAPLAIVQIEAKKVTKNDSLESIARAAGIKWQDLAFFNWGTKIPEEINQHLAKDVGCTKKTKDGRNYLFDDSDTPGIIYVPKQWKLPGLGTAQKHVVRVKPLEIGASGQVNLLVRLQIDPADPANVDDHFILYDAGGFRLEKTIDDDQNPGDEFVDLLFEGLDRNTPYTLEVNCGEGRPTYLVFENMNYEQIQKIGAGPA